MAQFGFENDMHGILKLDVPIANAPVAKWRRKPSSTSGLSPGKPGNASSSSSKTPSKTPAKTKRPTPSKIGGDRYIPVRNTRQMEVASFLMTRRNDSADLSSGTAERRKAMSVLLNGYNIEEARVLHFGARPLNASEGYQNNLKVLYHQATPASLKKTRYISPSPDRILDAPDLKNDFYLTLLDWSSQNVLAVALNNNVYLWNAAGGDTTLLMQVEQEAEYICSVSWTKQGSYLAVGTSDHKIHLLDVEKEKLLRTLSSHTDRVSSLSWNDHLLSSGSKSGQIHHHDVRVADHHLQTLAVHTQEVCGLKWSPDGRYLASGSNDNLVCVWPRANEGGAGNDGQPVCCWNDHQGAVKALAWCPWQHNVLASGGGTSDRRIRIWNVNSSSCIDSLETPSQISSLVFAPNYKELVSAHGYTCNSVSIWKYPSLTRVTELSGHGDRILSMTMSPDCSTIATVAADETIRLWKSFEMDPVRKKASEKGPKVTSRLNLNCIR